MSVEMKIEINEKEKLDAKVPQDEIGHVYDRLAGIYDIWGKLTESRARNRAIELAEIRNGQNILEVAVGTGLAFYEIVKRNPDGINIGVDLSKGMLKKDGKLVLVNMAEGERFGSRIYDFLYTISPRIMGGCRGVKLKRKLEKHGFRVDTREYYQQMLFPSEVVIAYK